MSNRRRKSKRQKKVGQIEFVMFEADKPDMMGLSFDREQLESDILPRVQAKPEVTKAWMDGDKLVAQIKTGAIEDRLKGTEARRQLQVLEGSE